MIDFFHPPKNVELARRCFAMLDEIPEPPHWIDRINGFSKPKAEGDMVEHDQRSECCFVRVSRFILDEASIVTALDGITGAAYRYGYRFPGARPGDEDAWVLFRRYTPLENGTRTFVSPDRRDRFQYDTFSGLYCPKQEGGGD